MSQIKSSQDEVSLIEVVEFFRHGWKVLVGFVTLFGVLALLIANFLPIKYQAWATIEPAKVSFVERGPLEVTPQALSQKMKLPSFYSRATMQVCMKGAEASGYDALLKELKTQALPESTFVTVTFKAPSAERAEECLRAVYEDVAAQQNTWVKPAVQETRGYIESLKQMLAKVEQMKVAAAEGFAPDSKDASSAPFINAFEIMAQTNAALDLRERIAEANMNLAPPFTHGTRLALPIYSADQPVSPKTKWFLAAGLALGFVLGMAYLLFRRLYIKMKAQRAN